MKKSITQKNSLGCGLACIAFLLDKSYDEILAQINDQKINTLGLFCKDIIKILDYYGQKFEYRYIKPKLKKRIYKENTIIYIKKSKKYPAGHYLIRFDNHWMDPWINFPINQNISNAKSGFRKRLPDRPIYMIYPK